MPRTHRSSISQFWGRLEGSVHPDDERAFAAYPKHTFNLKFPPPASIGAVDTAPIVILMSNGGYKSGITESEFPDEESIREYSSFIRGEAANLPPRLASYYVAGPFADWIANGSAVLVNAVAYRSPQLSKEAENKRVAKVLPSREAHRRWIMEEVLPEAAQGRRIVFVHRNRWWQNPKSFVSTCVIFSDSSRAEPNRPAPDGDKLERARRWLLARNS